jgi:hypothetical protein
MGYLAKADAILAVLRSKPHFQRGYYEKTKETKEVPIIHARTDDSTNIIVDVPNPDRRRAAMQSLGCGPGDAFEGDIGHFPTYLDQANMPAMIQPGSDEALLSSIREAGFIAIDLEASESPAWVAYGGLAVSLATIAASMSDN